MSAEKFTPAQKKAWREAQSTSRNGKPLPRNAVLFWAWGKPGPFREIPTRGAFGRQRRAHGLGYKLDARRVVAAQRQSLNAAHQFKFMSRAQKEGVMLRATIFKAAGL